MHRRRNTRRVWLLPVIALLASLLSVPFAPEPASALPVNWWDSTYTQRKPITIQSFDALETGYQVQASFDHAAMVGAGQSLASGNDVRVVRWNGSTWQELDRVLVVGSSWNLAATKVFFKLNAAIPANSTVADYFLYYGNASAGSPPGNAANVFDFFDDFDDNSYDTSKWGTPYGDGTTTETGGEIRITGNTVGYSGFGSNATFGSGTVAEFSFRIAAQTTNSQSLYEASLGIGSMGISGTPNKKVAWYGGGTWHERSPTVSLTPRTFPYQRITTAHGPDDVVRWFENGRAITSQTNITSSHPFFFDFEPNDSGAYDVRLDDVVIRKYVVNEPVATVSTSSEVSSWNSAFTTRQQIVVAADTALPSGYSVDVTFDHASMVSRGSSLASGNDVRVVYRNGSTWTELDRVLAVGSVWNSPSTRLYFRTQAAIAATTVNGRYYLYYGNAAAGTPPANANNVYDLFDDFSGGALNSAKWNAQGSNGVDIEQTGGQLRVTGTTDSGNAYQPMGIVSVATSTSDLVTESTFSINSQSTNAHTYWKGSFGIGDGRLGIRNGSADKRVQYYDDPVWVDVADSSADAQSFSNLRVAETLTSDGVASHAEDGLVLGTRSGTSVASGARIWSYSPDTASATFDVRFDDIVVRKHVANPPRAQLTVDASEQGQISTGDTHTCYVAPNNAGMCWGSDSNGQLGNGATTGTQGAATLVDGGYSWASISAGLNASCGVTTAGVGYCWGTDSEGRIGNGTALTAGQSSPSPVAGGHTWATIVAGSAIHACGITTTGDAYCWGGDSNGRLGNGGANASEYSPSPVGGSHKWSSISPGANHSCGVTTTGIGYCWGEDGFGQVGETSDTSDKTSPTLVDGGHVWQDIRVGTSYSCGLTTSGAAYCWGLGNDGRLGNGALGSTSVPGAVGGGHLFSRISSGDNYSCATKANGSLWCWGYNAYSQLGNGNTTNQSVPVQIGSAAWAQTSNGFDSTCAVTADTGYPHCWGRNDTSEVGDGSTTLRSTPVYSFVTLPLVAGATGQAEGNSGTSVFATPITNTASQIAVVPVSTSFTTSNGTATSGSDYVATTGTATVQPGSAMTSADITVNGDVTFEADETFTVTIGSPSTGGSISTAATTVTITNDDVAPPDTPTALNQTRTNGDGIPKTTLNSFDSSAEGWTAGAPNSVAVESGVVRNGAGSLRITTTTGSGFIGNNNGSLHDQTADGPTLSAWVYLPSANTGSNWQASVQIQDASYGYVPGPFVNLVANQWNLVTFTPTFDQMKSIRAVAVYTGGTGATGTNYVYVDDVQQGSGMWTNESSVRLGATASASANTTLSVCAEVKAVGAAFTNNEDSCGTPVPYTGMLVTPTVTIGSLTSGTHYHWQLRTKDTAGNYSSWVTYGGNTESSADFAVDTTAPTTGTVYDGSSTGVDANYNLGSLSSLSANWSGFTDGMSGIAKYEYSVGTTAGATDVADWVGTSQTSISSTGLLLRTGQRYWVNVRVTDVAGNTATVSSNGQSVAPTLTFSTSSNSLNFDDLNPNNSYTSVNKSLNVTTSTNAYSGYVVRQYVLAPLSSGSSVIGTYPGTYASPSSWSGTGFGYTTSDTSIQASGNPFNGATRYAGLSPSSPGDIVADHVGTVVGAPVTGETFSLTYRLVSSSTQPAGSYTTTLILSATAMY